MDASLFMLNEITFRQCPDNQFSNVSTVLSNCADLTLVGNDKDDVSIIGATKPLLLSVQHFTVTQFLFQARKLNIPIDIMKNSLREIITLVSSKNPLLFFKQLREIVGNNTVEPSNMTLLDVYNAGISKHNLSNINSSTDEIASWANYSPPLTMNLKDIASTLMMSLEETLLLTFGQTIQLLKAVNGSKVYLPFNYVARLCNKTTNATKIPLQSFVECIGDTTDLKLNGFTRVRTFNVDLIKSLSHLPPDELANADLYTLVYVGNKAIDKMYELSRQPLILLARGKGISLTDLQEHTLITTLKRIFNVDDETIRTVFPVDQDIYMLLKTHPLKDLINQDSGLQNVQELYTGSLQTMISAAMSGKGSTFAIEEHLPRYVSLLSSKKLIDLFLVYETNMTELMKTDLAEIVHRFFGVIQPTLFKITFTIDDDQYERLKKSRLHDVLTLGTKYTTNTSLRLDENLMNNSLSSLIGFITTIDQKKFDFFITRLRNEMNGNDHIGERPDFDNFNSTFRLLLSEQVKGIAAGKEEVQDAVVDYFLLTNITVLAMNIGKNQFDVLDMNLIELVQVFLKCK